MMFSQKCPHAMTLSVSLFTLLILESMSTYYLFWKHISVIWQHWCNSFVNLDARQSNVEDMLCAREAHVFKPFGRQYCTVHPGYCNTERTLPSSDCPTISIIPPSLRTLKEDVGSDRPKVVTIYIILISNCNWQRIHWIVEFILYCVVLYLHSG